MKIAIDARPAEKERFGIAKYTYELIMALKDIPTGHDYVLLVNTNKLADFVVQQKNFRLYKIKSKWLGLGEQFEIPLALKKIRPDVFHATSFVVPVWQVVPTIVTIHDLIHLIFPEHYGLKHKIYFRLILKSILSRTQKIIAVSKSTKRDLINWYGIENQKIVVIYHGVSNQFRPIDDPRQIDIFKRQHSLPERFILYIGNRKRHKNLKGLFRAFANFKKFDKDQYYLVISGEQDHETEKLAGESGVKDWLVYTGKVLENELPLLYNSASLFVFLSLYEGFGLPPLEAMACGVPVIASNVSSLPEVVGEGGILVNPMETEQVGRLMQNVLTNSSLAEELKIKGLRQAANFTWEKCAMQTLEAYSTLL
jgi:glycosyltransferase involved in cell wall biosynthesis